MLLLAFIMRLLAFACSCLALGCSWGALGCSGEQFWVPWGAPGMPWGALGNHLGVKFGALRASKSDAFCMLCKNMFLHAVSELEKRQEHDFAETVTYFKRCAT